ncbi:MAG: DUF308 domain-containing protein [Pseudomonadota bacterium]
MDNLETDNGNKPDGGRLLAAGTALVLTGLLAMVFPLATTLAVEIMVGSFLLVAGIAVGIQAFSEPDWNSTLAEALIAVIYMVGGVALLVTPIGGAIALTAMLGVIFVVDGICRCVIAFWFRSTTYWIAALLSGCLSVLLGGLVLAGLGNGSSLAFIGLLVGVNLILSGATLASLGWAARNAEKQPGETTTAGAS